jgi:EmrB/QacA subfamily drug resistance transporter
MTTELNSKHSTSELSHREILIVFSGLMLGMLLAALDQTIVATALPTIVGSLKGSSKDISWVVTAYLITSTATTPLYGKLSDLYGRKITFQVAIVLFLIGSALTGLSQNIVELIAFRALQGLGGGGLMALAMAIIGDIVPAAQRGKYQGYVGAVFAFASVTGPLAGGFFVDQLSWRWCFYINLPIGIVALFVTSAVLKIHVPKKEHSIDYLGAAVLTAGVSVLILALAWGGQLYAWGSSIILSCLILGTLMCGFFVFLQTKVKEPILPLSLFKNSIFTVSSAATFFLAMSMFGAIVYLPFYLQFVKGQSPTISGLALLPIMVGIVGTSIGAGLIVTRTGKYKIFPIFGSIFMTIGMWMLSHIEQNTSYLYLSLSMIVLGAGMGMMMQNLVLATQNAVDFSLLGTATSAVSFFRTLGGVFGTAIFGAIFSSRMSYYQSNLFAGKRPKGNFTSGITPQMFSSLPTFVKKDLIAAFVNSLHPVFEAGIPVGIITFVIVLFLRQIPLRTQTAAGKEKQKNLEPVI